MKQPRKHSETPRLMSKEPASVRFAVAFSSAIESLAGMIVRGISDLFDRNERPTPKPVPVRVRRSDPRYPRR